MCERMPQQMRMNLDADDGRILVAQGSNATIRGIYKYDEITCINCSVVDEKYRLIYEPMIYEFDSD